MKKDKRELIKPFKKSLRNESSLDKKQASKEMKNIVWVSEFLGLVNILPTMDTEIKTVT